MKIAYAKDSQPPEREPEPAAPAADEVAPMVPSTPPEEPVPDGTTAEILAWVGGDPDRAQRALDKEQTSDRPRSGLTGELNKILG